MTVKLYMPPSVDAEDYSLRALKSLRKAQGHLAYVEKYCSMGDEQETIQKSLSLVSAAVDQLEMGFG